MSEPRPERVVLHVSHPGDGGVASAVLQLARDQDARGWRVAVATPPDGELAGALGDLAVPWQTGSLRSRHLLSEARRLLAIVDDVRPDLVHLHSAKAGLAGRLAIRRRIPTIFQPHAWSFDSVRGRARLVSLEWERLGARWADVILCVSAAERDRGVERRIRGRFTVITNGVDTSAFPPVDDAARAAARARLGLPDAPLVVCVGRLSHQKGQDILLAAWPRIAEAVAGARLVLVGDGETAEDLRRVAPDGVVFAGRRDDVRNWLAAADVVTLPSRWEGMAFALLEALATGCSVVATDVPGSREALDDSGAIVPVGDAGALAAAVVERLLDRDRREAEGRRAAERARRLFDVRETLSRVAELYDDLLGRRNSPAM
jgi:glycosyltransferase involved in cell wall biosynthesis